MSPMPETPETALLKLIRTAIADPGQITPREFEDRDGERIYETIPNWGARAVIAAVLPAVRAAERTKVAEEILADVEPFFAARLEPAMWEAAHRAAYVARGDRP